MAVTKAIRVIIADDHPVVRAGIRAMLHREGVAEVVAEASSPAEVTALLQSVLCDVLVTDLSMPVGPDPDGLTMLSCIRQGHRALPVVLFSVTTHPNILQVALACSVLGLVDKAADFDELPMAVSMAHLGKRYTSRNLRLGLLGLGVHSSLVGPSLSVRELEVLRLMADGRTVSEIARWQGRSVTTISQQKLNAMRKLGLNGEVELHGYLKDQRFVG